MSGRGTKNDKKTKHPNKGGAGRRRAQQQGRTPHGPVVQVDARKLAALCEDLRASHKTSISSSPSPDGSHANNLTLAEMPGTLQQVGREADRAWSGVKKIMSLLNTEFKAYDSNQVGTVSHWNGACTDMTGLILQGDADSQRDGDSAKLQRFVGKLTFYFGSTPTNTTVRFVVGKYKVGVLAATTIATEMCDNQGTVSAPRTIFSQWDKRKNYEVLFERVFEMDTVAHPRHFLDFDVKLDFDTQWIASGNTMAANGLFMVAYSTLATGVTAPLYDGTFRVEFTDN